MAIEDIIGSVNGIAMDAVNISNRYSSSMRNMGNGNYGGSYNTGDNPYAMMYSDRVGYIFGKPLSYTPRTDPNHRIYQHTILRNNTLLNIVPGKPYVDKDMLKIAEEILLDHEKKLGEIMVLPNSPSKEKRVMSLCQSTQDRLVSSGADLRYYSFRQDITGFLQSFQMVLSRVGSAVFGWNGASSSNFVTDLASVNLNVKEDVVTRGFKVWVDKGTSISETVDNSFTQSVLANAQKSMSNMARQARFLTGAMNMAGIQQGAEVVSADTEMGGVGKLTNIASSSLSGSNFQFPDIFDDSKFARSYEVSFRFMSPYGDDRSIYHHVLLPFMFLLTCSLPRQDGVSGFNTPFLLQLDAPGFFSCPMGVVTSLSFRKGGDEMLFNNRGLPLIIEGSMSVQDLYSNLSLPLTYSQFATNMGTTAFLNTLGGLNLYATMDPSIRNKAENMTKDLAVKVMRPYNSAREEYLKVSRYLGMSSW